MLLTSDSPELPITADDDDWIRRRPNSECGRSMLYRFEHNGILVYDCNARLSTEDSDSTSPCLQRDQSPQQRKSLKSCHNQYGKVYIDRLQFLNLKNYTPQKTFPQLYTLVVPQEDTLKFDSRFESGNLHKAIKISENEYDLILNYDTETKGHTQWYYFSVKNYKPGHTVKFNITNLMKFESLYNDGMKPAVFSSCKSLVYGLDWHRDSTDISYYQNTILRDLVLPCMEGKYFYTLSFTYTFQFALDTVSFAYCEPYTYTDLLSYLDTLTTTSSYSKYLRIEELCKTIAGNPCYLLTITRNIESYPRHMEGAGIRRFVKIRDEGKIKNNCIEICM